MQKKSSVEQSATVEPKVAIETETLIIYSGRGEKLVGDVYKAFEKKHGIKLQIKYGDTATLAALLIEEGKQSGADVFVAQDVSTLGFLDSKSFFSPMPVDVLNNVFDGMKSPSRTWVGLSGRSRVLAYKSSLPVEQLPKSIDDLVDTKWQGKIGWAPANASFQSFVAALIALRGKDKAKKWLLAMKKNKPKDYPKNTPAVLAISRGEIEMALVNHYYLHRLKKEHGEDFPVKNHYFRSGKSGSLVNLSGAAVLKSSKKDDTALSLITFLLSEEGQQLVVEKNHEFPVTHTAQNVNGLQTLESLKAPVVDPAAMSDLEETVALLKDTGVLL